MFKMGYYTKLALLELQGKEYDKDKELARHYKRLFMPFVWFFVSLFGTLLLLSLID